MDLTISDQILSASLYISLHGNALEKAVDISLLSHASSVDEIEN